MPQLLTFILIALLAHSIAHGKEQETLPALSGDHAPQSYQEMWSGFDPRSEPLDTEVLHEWREDGVTLRVVRFRMGVFKGTKATLAAIYGFPTDAANQGQKLPGLVQIHGGGQYADYKACLLNARRGYATLSIAWAGRISAPDYRVGPNEVKLFWNDQTDDPNYKLTTDWGAVDGYHAPGRHPGNVFPSARPAEWTLDEIESPRNSGWFLGALAARRALTFLERQPEVNPDQLGVYGHSMGGKLTVMASSDPRVKAAAPSCGGISDRHNKSELFRKTIGDDVNLRQIVCPVMFLSPSNDFHGRIGDLPAAIDEIQSQEWRVTCSPHRNHQDTPEYEVATLLWFDQHLRQSFTVPQTPRTALSLKSPAGVPQLIVRPDKSRPILSVDVYYTQHGKPTELPEDREDTMSRFWHHARAEESHDEWTARLPISDVNKPLWVYANVLYALDEPVSGAGYYYGTYRADAFDLSSLLTTVTPEALQSAGVQATLEPSLIIEDFTDGWEKEWFRYPRDDWAASTHKLRAERWKPPHGARLSLEVQSESPNRLVVLIDSFAADVELSGGAKWQEVHLTPADFENFNGESITTWDGIRRFKLSPAEHLKPARRIPGQPKVVGGHWNGPVPRFRNLRWVVSER